MKNWNKLSDGELVELIRKGSEAAYEQTFLRYYARVLKFIVSMTGNVGASEDAAQNIFLRLWLKRDTLDGSKSLKNLLFVMARNEALNLQKSGWSSVESIESVKGESCMPHIDVQEESDHAEMIHRVLSSMPERRQEVFRLSRYEQLSNKEIAQKLGLSVRTVEKHLELAMKDFRNSAS